MLKKIISGVLTAAMLIGTVSVLAGCGAGKGMGKAGSLDAEGNYVPGEELSVTLWYTQGTDFAPQSKLEKNIVE